MSDRLRDQWWARSSPRSKYRRRAVVRGLKEHEVWMPRTHGWAPRDAAGREIKRQEWVGERRFNFRGALSGKGGWTTMAPCWGQCKRFKGAHNGGCSDG